MKRPVDIINCETVADLPSLEWIISPLRHKHIKVIFSPAIIGERCRMKKAWKEDLKDFKVTIPMARPEINIIRLISDIEVIEHQDFFEQCAKDYHNLATQLITSLAEHLNITINPKRPLDSFEFLKHCDQEPEDAVFGDWNYFVHGYDCGFTNLTTGQKVEVSLVNELEFGRLDPYFFIGFIKSTQSYNSLPVEVYDDYTEGLRILEKMVDIGKFEKLTKGSNFRQAIVVTDRA